MEWDKLQEIVRPKEVHPGIMKVDPDRCASCGLCVDNCPFKCWVMDEAVLAMAKGVWAMYKDDELVKGMGPVAESAPYAFEPRALWGGIGTIVRGEMMPSLGAPCVILLAGDARAITGPQLNIGICGQNMNLVANSLGIRACWNGFLVSGVPAIADRIGLKPNWSVITTLVLGWPAFKQDGIVAREYRPVMWFREGSDAPEIEE